MSLHIRCPGCNTLSQVPDNSQGKTARCPKCGLFMRIPVQPIAAPAPVVFPPPVLAKAQSAQRAPTSAPPPWVYVAIGGGLLLVLGVVVSIFTGGFRPLEVKQTAQTTLPAQKATSANTEETPAKVDPAPTKEEAQPDARPKGEVNPKEELKLPSPPPPRPKVVPVPAGETPASIATAVTQKVKRATTYLKVTMANGQVAEGSGFFAAEPGLVFTNAHVVGMLGHATVLPSKVDIVVHSGEPGEFRREGQILGVDRVNDLGILRVFGSQEELPDPLPVDTTRNLAELQKVYIFGFPLGAALGKNITVSESSISSLRKESDGVVNQIQVNGGMHPGNSGGPVVDARGAVVGVAVAAIRGTQINFAVPGEKVIALLRGQAADIQFSEPFLDGGGTKLPIQITCIDPLSRLREVKVDVWTGEAGVTRAPSTGKPEAKSGDGPRKTVPLALAKGQAAVEAPVPSLGTGKVVWIQPAFTDVWGETYWGAATPLIPSQYPPLTRKPALVEQKYDTQPERTVKWTSSQQFHVSKGSKPVNVGESLLEVEVVETARKDPQGGHLDLFVASAKVSTQVDGKQVAQSLKGLDLLRGRYFTFVANPAGALVQRTLPTLPSPGSLDTQMNFTGVANRICKSYEMTCLSMPNRQVAPKESWSAIVPMVVSGEFGGEFVNAALTCTYEGSRLVRGQNQAMIALAGNLQGQRGQGSIGGKVTGKAHFALAGGLLSEATLRVETDVGGGSAYASNVMEVNMTRTPGNTLGVKPTPPPAALAKGKVIIDENGTLDQASPTNRPDGKVIAYRLFSPTLTAGVTYMIEMNKTDNSTDLDPYLLLNNPQGRKIAEDDDGGGDLNSRILFQATQTGVHQIYATALDASSQTGSFRLIVSEVNSSAKTAK